MSAQFGPPPASCRIGTSTRLGNGFQTKPTADRWGPGSPGRSRRWPPDSSHPGRTGRSASSADSRRRNTTRTAQRTGRRPPDRAGSAGTAGVAHGRTSGARPPSWCGDLPVRIVCATAELPRCVSSAAATEAAVNHVHHLQPSPGSAIDERAALPQRQVHTLGLRRRWPPHRRSATPTARAVPGCSRRTRRPATSRRWRRSPEPSGRDPRTPGSHRSAPFRSTSVAGAPVMSTESAPWGTIGGFECRTRERSSPEATISAPDPDPAASAREVTRGCNVRAVCCARRLIASPATGRWSDCRSRRRTRARRPLAGRGIRHGCGCRA